MKQTAIRLAGTRLTLNHLFAILAVLACLLAAAAAAPHAGAEAAKSRAALINACVEDMRKSMKPGHVMSNSQRMTAEDQCRAYADNQLAREKEQPAARPAGNGTAGQPVSAPKPR